MDCLPNRCSITLRFFRFTCNLTILTKASLVILMCSCCQHSLISRLTRCYSFFERFFVGTIYTIFQCGYDGGEFKGSAAYYAICRGKGVVVVFHPPSCLPGWLQTVSGVSIRRPMGILPRCPSQLKQRGISPSKKQNTKEEKR